MSLLFNSKLTERQPLACRIFDQAIVRGRLSHAYLLTGHTLKDKYLLAKFLACYLNCEQRVDHAPSASCIVRSGINIDADIPSGIAPGTPATESGAETICRNCRWIWAQAHPQAWLVLSGEESKSGRIAVEKARALSLELSKLSTYVRTIVIPDATRDCFHAPAANALLKTIEEPNSNSLFLLFAPDSASVLATIVSRCQVVPLVQPASSSLFRFPSEDKSEQEELHSTISKYKIYPERKVNPATTRGTYNTSSASGTFAPSTILDSPVISMLSGSAGTAIQWASTLETAASEGVDAHFLLDWVVSKEFDQLKDSATTDPRISLYLDRLLSLAQTTKDQLDSYVQPRAAFESFVLSLLHLSARNN